MRQQMARNAGYDNYCAYRWQQLYRFDYTPDDYKVLHEAVEQVIVPVASQFAFDVTLCGASLPLCHFPILLKTC